MQKLFPIMLIEKENKKEYIPWEVVAPHENQAMINHGQSLETLSRRGGLSYREMYAVLKDQKLDSHNKNKYSEIQYEFWVLKVVRDFYTQI